jgi:hypothetical protein
MTRKSLISTCVLDNTVPDFQFQRRREKGKGGDAREDDEIRGSGGVAQVEEVAVAEGDERVEVFVEGSCGWGGGKARNKETSLRRRSGSRKKRQTTRVWRELAFP